MTSESDKHYYSEMAVTADVVESSLQGIFVEGMKVRRSLSH